jgi:hypothetical protein
MEKKCSGVVLTLDATTANYILEAQQSDVSWEMTVYATPSGDVVFHTATRKLGNAVKDVCKALKVSKN